MKYKNEGNYIINNEEKVNNTIATEKDSMEIN